MADPNVLIFIDLTSDDPAAAGKFYADVFGWTNEGRPEGVFHRLVPGGFFKNPDGSDSQVGNLHMGIHNSKNARPFPTPHGAGPRGLAPEGRKARVWIWVGEDDNHERILKAAEDRGAIILWRNHYWSEFNGYNHAFQDPWGNEIVLWVKAGENPDVPDHFSRE